MTDCIEQLKDATSPEEMRAELFRLRHYDPLVRRVFDMADYNGMSAEDKYIALAYYAMKDRNNFLRQIVSMDMIRPKQYVVMREAPHD